MADHAIKKHPWHMVEPSPWPLSGAVAALVMAIGGIWFMHDGGLWLFLTGVGLLLVTFFGWWRDVIREAEIEKHHTGEVQVGLRMGFLWFIASEVMFFFAFFWAYFHASIPALSLVAQTQWPPEGIVPLDTWTVPFLNTLILLTSGATVTYAHHAVVAGEREKAIAGTFFTVVLGFIFLGFQVYEYVHAAFAIDEGIYPSTFYLATGFHGAHVFIGATFLAVCLYRLRAGHFTPKQHIGFEAAAWYWHFVDVVWLFLFVAVYWWGSTGYVHAG